MHLHTFLHILHVDIQYSFSCSEHCNSHSMMVSVLDTAQSIIWLAKSQSIVRMQHHFCIMYGRYTPGSKQFDTGLSSLRKLEMWNSSNHLYTHRYIDIRRVCCTHKAVVSMSTEILLIGVCSYLILQSKISCRRGKGCMLAKFKFFMKSNIQIGT